MRSQVLHYISSSFPHSPGLLVGLWGARSSFSFPILPPLPGLLVALWGARSFTILPPPPWLACRSMRSQVLYYPSPTPLACLYVYEEPGPSLSFPILPPLPWLDCRFMRSQVLHYISSSFPHSPGLLVGLWGARSSFSFPILPPLPGLLVALWGARSFTILPPPPWLACRSMRSQVLYYPSPTPLACLYV